MFKYRVIFYDSIEEKEIVEQGILGAKSYGAAANKLVEYYDKSCVISIALEEIDNIMSLDGITKEINKENYFYTLT